MSLESTINRSMWQFAAAYAIALALNLYERVAGVPPIGIMTAIILVPTILRWGLQALSLSALYITSEHWDRFSTELNAPETHRNLLGKIRLFQALVIIMPSLLAVSLLTRGGAPRVAGAAINLSLAWLFFQALQTWKTSLQQPNDDLTTTTTD
jgi:hypothetical protein